MTWLRVLLSIRTMPTPTGDADAFVALVLGDCASAATDASMLKTIRVDRSLALSDTSPTCTATGLPPAALQNTGNPRFTPVMSAAGEPFDSLAAVEVYGRTGAIAQRTASIQ
jgi:hypothetical protein